MELQRTLLVSCSNLSHEVACQRCPPSHVKSGFTGAKKGVTVHRGRELSTWRNSRVGVGQFVTVEFLQTRLLLTQSKLTRKGKVVANSVKDEEAEVDSAVESSKDVQQAVETGGGSSFLTFLCPLLKLIGGGDPAAPRNSFLETATSGAASLARLPWGSQVGVEIAAERNKKGQPPQLFQLYEFEACPFCRRVREALTELDLSAEVYPCPKGSRRHREFVLKNGGKEQFCSYPYFSFVGGKGVSITAGMLMMHSNKTKDYEERAKEHYSRPDLERVKLFPYFHDPNTGVFLYESSEIVNYLFKEYGGGRKPTPGLLESTLVTGWVPTIMRAGRGMMLYSKATSNPPPEKLELFSYENNQFSRLVRETLCELELPYILRNTGKGSSSKDSLLKLAGSTQVPYLVDPNTGRSMAESLNIITYLFETYGASA